MNRFLFIGFVSFISFGIDAQITFTDTYRMDCLPVINQQKTGTCWSYSTTSYLESEIIRIQNKQVDLSEMYNVRCVYIEKALNYILRQGKANFSQGSLAHDVLNTYQKYGAIPNSAYTGLTKGDTVHQHDELEGALKNYLDAVIQTGKPSAHFMDGVNALLDIYLGKVPDTFTFDGKSYTPLSFAKELGINPNDYLHLTSFSHHPFYSHFVLEIPDNFSNQSFINLPLDELLETIDHALKNGYTVEWDGDVSEKSFSQTHGVAYLPENKKNHPPYEQIPNEISFNQELRQQCFFNYTTTDDHLMHIVGLAKDNEGNTYYIIKNSWGDVGPFKGYLYMSKAYMAMKTISVTLHKDAVPKQVMAKY